MLKAADYEFIMAWHALTGSSADYWRKVQLLAEKTQAPADAIYRDSAGVWHTVSDLGGRHPWTNKMKKFLKENT